MLMFTLCRACTAVLARFQFESNVVLYKHLEEKKKGRSHNIESPAHNYAFMTNPSLTQESVVSNLSQQHLFEKQPRLPKRGRGLLHLLLSVLATRQPRALPSQLVQFNHSMASPGSVEIWPESMSRAPMGCFIILLSAFVFYLISLLVTSLRPKSLSNQVHWRWKNISVSFLHALLTGPWALLW